MDIIKYLETKNIIEEIKKLKTKAMLQKIKLDDPYRDQPSISKDNFRPIEPKGKDLWINQSKVFRFNSTLNQWIDVTSFVEIYIYSTSNSSYVQSFVHLINGKNIKNIPQEMTLDHMSKVVNTNHNKFKYVYCLTDNNHVTGLVNIGSKCVKLQHKSFEERHEYLLAQYERKTNTTEIDWGEAYFTFPKPFIFNKTHSSNYKTNHTFGAYNRKYYELGETNTNTVINNLVGTSKLIEFIDQTSKNYGTYTNKEEHTDIIDIPIGKSNDEFSFFRQTEKRRKDYYL